MTAGDASKLAAPPINYPIQLGIAYLLLVGYLVRTLFVSFRLPASVGVILTGFSFSYFFQTDILFGRDLLQQLSFFLVLLTAGLEITWEDLTLSITICATLPVTFELVALTGYAVAVLDYTVIEGVVMGTVLMALGDGLVIPKMKEFGTRFKGHPLPRLVFTWAPLEASFTLTVFGIIGGLSEPANEPSVEVGSLVIANIVRLAATLGVGAILGAGAGWLIPRRVHLTINGQQIFTGKTVESFLMVIAVAFIAFGLGAGEDGKEMVPMGFSPGSLLQPELLVIVTGASFAAVTEHDLLCDVEGVMGGLWVFGQLILFSMLGSRTTPEIFPHIVHVLPIILVGLLFRFIGVVLAMVLTWRRRGRRDISSVKKDSLFCFLCMIPRATLQGALGAVPVNRHFFNKSANKQDVQAFIFVAARLYIVCMSIVGMILLNTLGPRLLQATEEPPPAIPGDDSEGLLAPAGHVQSMDWEIADAVDLVAEEYSIDPGKLLGILRGAMTSKSIWTEEELTIAVAGAGAESSLNWARCHSAPSPPVRKDAAEPPEMAPTTSQMGSTPAKASARRRFTSQHEGMALTQFDAMGPSTVPSRRRSVSAGGIWDMQPSQQSSWQPGRTYEPGVSSTGGANAATSGRGRTASAW